MYFVDWEKKGQAALCRLYFRAALRVSKNRRVLRLPQELGN